MRVEKALWLHFQSIRESRTKSRYRMGTAKGRAEKDRVYWADRTNYTRRQGKYKP